METSVDRKKMHSCSKLEAKEEKKRWAADIKRGREEEKKDWAMLFLRPSRIRCNFCEIPTHLALPSPLRAQITSPGHKGCQGSARRLGRAEGGKGEGHPSVTARLPGTDLSLLPTTCGRQHRLPPPPSLPTLPPIPQPVRIRKEWVENSVLHVEQYRRQWF